MIMKKKDFFCLFILLFVIVNVDAKKKYYNKSKFNLKEPVLEININLYPVQMKGLKDYDGDGIADIYDDCPSTKGGFARNGCPDFDYTKLITFGSHKVSISDEEFSTCVDILKHIEYGENNKLTKESEKAALVLIDLCKKKKYTVEISSHVDLGKNYDNALISKERAEELKKLFVKHKIPAKSVKIIYYGDTMPVVDLPPNRFEVELNVKRK